MLSLALPEHLTRSHGEHDIRGQPGFHASPQMGKEGVGTGLWIQVVFYRLFFLEELEEYKSEVNSIEIFLIFCYSKMD